MLEATLNNLPTDVAIFSAAVGDFKVKNSKKEKIKKDKISELSLEKIESLINSIGLYKNKAKNIQHTSKLLITKYNSNVPQSRKELETLPGVGRKTANVILNTIFNQPVIAVDTHIFRLANRINLAKGKTPLEVETKLTRFTPDEFLIDAHHLLILHGRYVCKAQKPDCSSCCIYDFCEYKKKLIKT